MSPCTIGETLSLRLTMSAQPRGIMRLSMAAALVLAVTATAVGAVQIPAGADVAPRAYGS